MKKMIVASISAVVLVALGTTAYAANEWRVCSNLEEDFLTSVETYGRSARAASLATSVGVEFDHQAQSASDDQMLRLQEMQLERIYSRCGTDAGEAAASKLEDAFFGR